MLEKSIMPCSLNKLQASTMRRFLDPLKCKTFIAKMQFTWGNLDIEQVKEGVSSLSQPYLRA